MTAIPSTARLPATGFMTGHYGAGPGRRVPPHPSRRRTRLFVPSSRRHGCFLAKNYRGTPNGPPRPFRAHNHKRAGACARTRLPHTHTRTHTRGSRWCYILLCVEKTPRFSRNIGLHAQPLCSSGYCVVQDLDDEGYLENSHLMSVALPRWAAKPPALCQPALHPHYDWCN